MSLAEVAADQHELDVFELKGSPIGEYLSDIVRLPGYGDLEESCEQIQPIAFCDRGHIQFGGKDPCNRRTCPVHWSQWRKRAAASAVARMAAYRAASGSRWSPGRRALHIVAAPDQEQRWTCERFWSERSASYDPVAEAGARGGAVVPHAYRVGEAGEELWRWLGGAAAQDRGKWAALRAYADGWEELKTMIEVAPHTHHLAAAEDVDGETVEEIEAATGWVVTNVRSLAPFYVDANDALPVLSRAERAAARRADTAGLEALEEAAEAKAMEGYEDMARLTMYLMSHGAVQPQVGDLPQRQTVTYWGELHPNAFDPAEELGAETWATIQRYAAAALGLEDDPEGDGEGVGRRCSRDACDAPVRPLTALRDRLADPDHSWWDGLAFDQQCELLGADQWMSHKPPPGAGGDLPPGGFRRSAHVPPGVETEADWLEWLRARGRARYQGSDVPFLTVGMTPP